MDRFSIKTHELLIRAGWFEGRQVLTQVELMSTFSLFPAARNVLQEFGNLHIGTVHLGIDWSAYDIEILPTLAEDCGFEEDLISESARLGVKFYPLGQACKRNVYLFIDDRGRVYSYFEELIPVASTFDKALEILLLGLAREPLADPT